MSKSNLSESAKYSRRNTYWNNDNLDYIYANKFKKGETRRKR